MSATSRLQYTSFHEVAPAVAAVQKKEIAFQAGCTNAKERRLTARALIYGRLSKKRRACSIIFFYEQYFVLRTRSRDDFRRP